jgi:hypothetical protein
VFNKERNKTLELLNTGKIFNLGFKQINETDEKYYGSATVASTYTSNSDLFDQIQRNYPIKLKELQKLESGTYQPKVPRRITPSTFSATPILLLKRASPLL